MATNDELQDSIKGFRAAEQALADLGEQVEQLASATSSLDTARNSLTETGARLNGATEELGGTARKMAGLSTLLAEAIGSLQKADPGAVLGKIAKTEAAIAAMGASITAAGEANTARIEGTIETQACVSAGHIASLKRLVLVKLAISFLALGVAVWGGRSSSHNPKASPRGSQMAGRNLASRRAAKSARAERLKEPSLPNTRRNDFG